MSRIWAKIEGLKTPADAARVVSLGADAIGLVFAQSPRRVSPERAANIVAALPSGVGSVGVFVNSPPSEINRTAELVNFSLAQLHGEEHAHMVAQIRRPCIKAFRIRDERWQDMVRQWLGELDECGGRENLFAILLDAYDPDAAGGTGRRFNWSMVADARQRGELDDLPRIILAGGLDAECVADGIEAVRPWGVDVASGVEEGPGVKDFAKVQAFIDAVRRKQAELLEMEASAAPPSPASAEPAAPAHDSNIEYIGKPTDDKKDDDPGQFRHWWMKK